VLRSRGLAPRTGHAHRQAQSTQRGRCVACIFTVAYEWLRDIAKWLGMMHDTSREPRSSKMRACTLEPRTGAVHRECAQAQRHPWLGFPYPPYEVTGGCVGT
jgi:hypothetical protein